MKILTAEEIRQVDRSSAENFGIPSIMLMENAGMRVVEAIDARVEDLNTKSVVILCGKGNNGGDGFVVARQLIQRDCFPSVFLFAEIDAVGGDARANLDILTSIGHPPLVIRDREEWNSKRRALGEVDIVVDALLGTGLSKPVEGILGDIVQSLDVDFGQAMVVSIDVPSGCAADTGNLEGPAVQADLTVTLSAAKRCLVFPPAHQSAGEVVIADIGNPVELLESDAHQIELLLDDSFPDALWWREDDTHKGDYGKILVIGGSRGKSGAPALAGHAALASGAGLVTIGVPESVLGIVAGYMPELMTEPLPETDAGTLTALNYGRIEGLIDGKSLVALGPGIGRNPETDQVIGEIIRRIEVPVVLDADGLNAFVGRVDKLRGRNHPLVITPHPGEMARLLDRPVSEIGRQRLDIARDFAKQQGLYVVLKGFRTVIACPDGKAYVNSTGNPGMATAGSGDVLTGMIAGILGQPHLGTFEERLCLAVYLHGLSGDLAVSESSEETLLATDLIEFLPDAWANLRSE